MRKIASAVVCLISTLSIHAQSTGLTKSGSIEFEKSINTIALIKNYMVVPLTTALQSNIDYYRMREAQFKKLKSNLLFSADKSLFTPVPDYSESFISAHPFVNQGNTIYTDLTSGKMVSQKKVFEETFLVKDDTRKIDWKITTETREIAGYTCRRANAIIMDSIYVVAFYTGAIPVSGGPESFTGLPGMILGVVIPSESITWYATKVLPAKVPPGEIKPPSKGKNADNKQLRETLDEVLKSKGIYAGIYLRGMLL